MLREDLKLWLMGFLLMAGLVLLLPFGGCAHSGSKAEASWSSLLDKDVWGFGRSASSDEADKLVRPSNKKLGAEAGADAKTTAEAVKEATSGGAALEGGDSGSAPKGTCAFAEPLCITRRLEVSCNKTCMLVFPAAIKSADRGANYLLAARVAGVDNVLKVKAGKPDFLPTSLTVITADGRVYAFEVGYVASPRSLVLDLTGRAAVGDPDGAVSDFSGTVDFGDDVHMSSATVLGSKGAGEMPGLGAAPLMGAAMNMAVLDSCATRIASTPGFIKGVGSHRYGIRFSVEGIYIKRDMLFFSCRLQNSTSIPFRMGSLGLFMRDLNRTKRTAVQDNELPATFIKRWGSPEATDGQIIVVAVPRFTLSDNKYLAIELMEEAGDRALLLKLKERKLRKTRAVSSL